MNSHALAVLEFPRVLDEVAGRARSELGAGAVRALPLSTDPAAIEREHARVAAVRALREGEGGWRADAVSDLHAPIDRLRILGSRWTPAELGALARLLASARKAAEVLADEKRPAAARGTLRDLASGLHVNRALEAAITKAVADDGTIRDEASPALRRLRRELRASEAELVKLLERQLAGLDESARVPDMSVTMRNGRYVIPIRRDARARISGIVHDTSATGATLFVEPPAAVEFGNRIREMEADEREEVERIVLELTDRVRPSAAALTVSLDTLIEIDTLHARAAFAEDFRCAVPRLGSPDAGWSIDAGRHPLLLAQRIEVVAFDLEMLASERTIVISGPNTGGKTVLLKAVGLLSAMTQAGIPPTCAPGSVIPVFDDFFADIGDEQSIEASLSTFSAHLKNLSEILAGATQRSLVLIDELGSGTDPLEGASLGWAILEELNRRGTTTFATSHLGALKELAAEVPGVVNASLQFDAERLAPTYTFVKGIPGRSFGISIARRLSLPDAVLARAEERLPRAERDATVLLEALELQKAELERSRAEIDAILDDARRRVQSVAKREKNVRERERELERQSRQEARKYLLNARAEIDRLVRDLRKTADDRIEERGREARRHAEGLAAKQADLIEQLDVEERKAARTATPAAGSAATVGDPVKLTTMGDKMGRVLEIRGNQSLVAVGSMKLTVPLASLERIDPATLEKAVAWHGDLPEFHAKGEIDIRGTRADEAESLLMQAIDDAVRADLPALRIIHGKGTGALREVVAEMLRKDTRVKQFRLGASGEGGMGVTVAELA